MITAVDSSIILDVLIESPQHANPAENLLRRVAAEGKLIIGECVAAEILPAFRGKADFQEFLRDWEIDFVPSSLESSLLAGEYFAKHLQRGGKPKRVLPDFLIAGHACVHANRLLARDRGFFRDYFSQLKVLGPV
jgi:predicted nucleic acid-binding protein